MYHLLLLEFHSMHMCIIKITTISTYEGINKLDLHDNSVEGAGEREQGVLRSVREAKRGKRRISNGDK